MKKLLLVCFLIGAIFISNIKPVFSQTGEDAYDPIWAGEIINSPFNQLFNTQNFVDNGGQPSPDIWFAFEVSSTTQVLISTCNSSFDTYLTLYDENLNVIQSNNNNGPGCATPILASIIATLSPGTIYYVAAEGSGNYQGPLRMRIEKYYPPGPLKAGTNRTYPIDIGTIVSCGYYSDTETNDAIGNFGNDFGQSSDDIFYKFTLATGATVNISHCGSAINTVLSLLNSAGTLITANYSNGPLCPGNAGSLSMYLNAGTYYVVSEGQGSDTGSIKTSIYLESGYPPAAVGKTFSDPINVGTLTKYLPSYTDTKNNTCYGNEYGQVSPDIYYKFKINENTQVSISNCGSGFDTYIHLLNSSGTLLASNDDNGPICTGTEASLVMALSPGEYYVVSEGRGSGTGFLKTNISLAYGDDTRNWIMTRNFDDNGDLISESKSFFDNNGLPSQIQIKDLSSFQVLATDQVRDALGRVALSTLAAPINSSTFLYKENFIGNSTGKYNYTNFDYAKYNNPDNVNSSSIGTLGWYFSNNNSTEPYQATTGFPYSRTNYYADGTGRVKSVSGVGELLKNGSGHEVSSNLMPIINELNHYLQVRNKFFTTAQLGNMPAALTNHDMQLLVSKDENGQRGMVIKDTYGNVIMSGRGDATGQFTVNNTIVVTASATSSQHVFTTGATDGPYRFEIVSPYNVEVYKNGVLEYSGTGSNYQFSTSWLESKTFDIRSAYPFTVIYNGYEEHFIRPIESTYSQHYFNLLQPTAITLTGSYELYNMDSETLVSGSGTLPAGYYRLRAVTGSVNLTYSYKLSDVSYNVYNQKGMLVASINPEGIKALLTNGLNAYATLNSVPYVNTYEYDIKGRLTGGTTPDAGRSEFIYRNDGKIRFSQNALQISSGKFTYYNYDRWGRIVESGEYLPGSTTFTAAKSNSTLQENTDPDGGLTGGTKSSQVKAHFDLLDNSHGISGRVQDAVYLKSALSWTENADGKTWYNYDIDGRITWLIKYVNGLGYKTIDYTYLPNGNLLTLDYQKNIPAERFVHHYEYDSDLRLKNTFTSLDGINKTLQAKNIYYATGPLKRVELGNNLQGLDFTYTPQGWLKSVNHPNGNSDPGKDGIQNAFATDAFAMTLEYFNGDYVRSNSGIASVNPNNNRELFTGQIAGQTWKSLKPAAVVANYGSAVNNPAMATYEYKNDYQFDNNKYGTPNFVTNTFTAAPNGANREFGLSYDLHGNILSLTRSNSSGANNTLNYQYFSNTNKLQQVGSYASYTYDNLGQMASQVRSNGQGFYNSYDLSGKVISIYSDASKTQLRESFAYDEAGSCIRKTDHIQNITTYYVYGSVGNLLSIYDNSGTALQQKEIPVYATNRIGTYKRLTNKTQFELIDHLGNVRSVINQDKVSGLADILYYADYYPFGTSQGLAVNDYRYGYQGKFSEADKQTGWNNFNLRMYDPGIGRWMSTDPYGQFYSPYNGMGNDPVNSFDPSGGYTKWGAKWRRFFSKMFGDDPGEIYNTRGGASDYGFNTSSGDGFNFHVGFSRGLTGDQAIAMGLRNYGGDYTNSFFDWSMYTMDKLNEFNPIANAWDIGVGIPTGKDRLGNPLGSLGINAKFVGLLFAIKVKIPTGAAATSAPQFTKSSLSFGQEMHKLYRLGQEGRKEFRLLSGKRIDFLDINNGIIYELKPNNPRAIQAGTKQLNMYLKELQTPEMIKAFPELRGIQWKTVLDTY